MTYAGRRDRHGRGLRGPLAAPGVPVARSRSDRFDDLVRDAVERLQERLPDLARVDILVEDVLPESSLVAGAAIPRGRAEPATPHRRARLVVHRRTVELRAGSDLEREDVVRAVVTDLVAALFGLTPEQVDPDHDPP